MAQKRRNSFCVPSLPPLGSKRDKGVVNDNRVTTNSSTAASARPPLPPGHFLCNVNLDGNLLDIPDPPSPPKRVARRQSSPMLRPTPLRNVTNEKSQMPAATTVSTGKRSRKSLCHVSSPATEETSVSNETTDPLPETTTNESAKEAKASGPASSSLICFDEDIEVSSIKRQKRRESMILPRNMAPLSMEDVSDDSLNSAESEGMKTNVEADVSTETDAAALLLEEKGGDDSSTANKRHSNRLSIVLPTDIASLQEEVAHQVFGNDEDAHSQMKEVASDDCVARETALVHHLQQDDDRSSPVKIKRQSILLPSSASLLQEDDEMNEFFGNLKDHERKKVASSSLEEESTTVLIDQAEAVLAENTSNNAASIGGMHADYIRTLVREYCSLPTLAERNVSKQAAEIERLTEYSLVPSAVKQEIRKQKSPGDNAVDDEMMVSKQNDSVMAKRQLLLKLGAMVELMDNRKVEDIKHMETSTQCRFERSRSGKYRYYHLFTNRKISPQEYEKLYLETVKESKAAMSKRIRDWLRDNKQLEREMNDEEIHNECLRLSALVESAQRPVSEGDEQPIQLEMSPIQNSAALLESPKTQVDPSSSSASDSDMEESPPSESDGVDKNGSPPPVVVQQQADVLVVASDADTSCMEEADTSVLSLEDQVLEADAASSLTSSHSNQEAIESEELLLPLPSRDETSDDPAIAAAEERLWSEIDAALERYSRQVLAILEARAAQQKHS